VRVVALSKRCCIDIETQRKPMLGFGGAEPQVCGRRPRDGSESRLDSSSLRCKGDDTCRRTSDPKQGRSRRHRARLISGAPVKWLGACETGGWGRSSDDGSGQNNPIRSQGPLGLAAEEGWRGPARYQPGESPGARDKQERVARTRRRAAQTGNRKGPSDRRAPALKPYWGKPAVRNFRGGWWKPGTSSVDAPEAPLLYSTIGMLARRASKSSQDRTSKLIMLLVDRPL
jgi:hypothetical protein